MLWTSVRPERLVDQSSPEELLAEIQAAPPSTITAARALDFVLRQWTVTALSRDSDIYGLMSLADLVAASLRLLNLDEGALELRVRWSAFQGLIESKRLAIGPDRSKRARQLLHAQPILDQLRHGELPQSTLRERLKLSAPRASQILAVMEQAQLIRRRRVGKENMVSLAQAMVSEQPNQSRRARIRQSTGALIFGGGRPHAAA